MSNLDPQRERAAVLDALGAAGRAQSTAVVLFHTNLARRLGLGATDFKVLELVARESVLSPKELRERTGLAPASITGILDRLESKKFVERRTSASDRRGVEVVHSPHHTRVVGELFAEFMTGLNALHERYSTQELDLVRGYVEAAARLQHEAALGLADE